MDKKPKVLRWPNISSCAFDLTSLPINMFSLILIILRLHVQPTPQQIPFSFSVPLYWKCPKKIGPYFLFSFLTFHSLLRSPSHRQLHYSTEAVWQSHQCLLLANFLVNSLSSSYVTSRQHWHSWSSPLLWNVFLHGFLVTTLFFFSSLTGPSFQVSFSHSSFSLLLVNTDLHRA